MRLTRADRIEAGVNAEPLRQARHASLDGLGQVFDLELPQAPWQPEPVCVARPRPPS